jgi:hypothetical protein
MRQWVRDLYYHMLKAQTPTKKLGSYLVASKNGWIDRIGTNWWEGEGRYMGTIKYHIYSCEKNRFF